MQTIRAKTINSLFISSFAAMLLITPHAEAHSPRAREADAIVNTINYAKRTLSLGYPQSHGPKTVVWNSDTEFLCGGKIVSATELKEGTHLTIYYHSPFWGKPFATKIIWPTSPDK
ncbi:MAG: hypothetical protein WBW41_07880 [Verrucomicrobiia bacterium]